MTPSRKPPFINSSRAAELNLTVFISVAEHVAAMQRVTNAMSDAQLSLVSFHDALEAMPVDVPSDIVSCTRCRDSGLLRYPVVEDVGSRWQEIECHHCNAYFFRNRDFRSQYQGEFQPEATPQEGANPDNRVVHRDQHWNYAENALVERVRYASGRQEVFTIRRDQLIRNNMRELAGPRYLSSGTNHNARRALAESILKRHLSEEQKQDFETNQAFDVRGGNSGKVYRVHYEQTNNVVCEGARYCTVLTRGEPLPDQMLAQKLMITHHEDKFVRIAVRSGNGGRIYGGGVVRVFHDDPFDDDRTGVDWPLVSGSIICAVSALFTLWALANAYDWLVRWVAKL